MGLNIGAVASLLVGGAGLVIFDGFGEFIGDEVSCATEVLIPLALILLGGSEGNRVTGGIGCGRGGC